MLCPLNDMHPPLEAPVLQKLLCNYCLGQQQRLVVPAQGPHSIWCLCCADSGSALEPWVCVLAWQTRTQAKGSISSPQEMTDVSHAHCFFCCASVMCLPDIDRLAMLLDCLGRPLALSGHITTCRGGLASVWPHSRVSWGGPCQCLCMSLDVLGKRMPFSPGQFILRTRLVPISEWRET